MGTFVCNVCRKEVHQDDGGDYRHKCPGPPKRQPTTPGKPTKNPRDRQAGKGRR